MSPGIRNFLPSGNPVAPGIEKFTMESQPRMSKAERAVVKKIRGPPRKQKGARLRKPRSTNTGVALQELASVVAQQHHVLATMQASPLGASLFKGRSDLGDLGDGVDKSIRAIKRMLNTEVKCFQAAGANITPTTTGTITDFLSGIAQGVTDITRVGDSLKVLRLTMNYNFQMNSTANGTQVCWVAILRANDEIMTAAQLNTLDGNAYAYLGDYAWDYKDQYRVLWEKRILVDPEHQAHVGRVNLRLNDHAQYNAGGNTLNSGSIFMAIWSNSTTNNPDFGYVLQVEFVDN